jgi:hypothetical protein
MFRRSRQHRALPTRIRLFTERSLPSTHRNSFIASIVPENTTQNPENHGVILRLMNTAPYLVPHPCLDRLSDSELLAATRSLVGRSNQLLAALLTHLGEVEARGIHRIRACSSLYTYCIHELRLSEDEAYRRVAASRLVRRFPALLEAIASGELHLTGLLMLGPHLTENNLSEVLRRAKHRTKKEVTALVRVLDPLPDIPARIEPLGPAPARSTSGAPSWSAFVEAMCPVRELAPGDRPRDWVANDDPVANDEGQVINPVSSEEGPVPSDAEGAEQTGGVPVGTAEAPPCTAAAPLGTAEAPTAEPALLEAPAPARLEPQRYRVQFTASEEYVKLVEEAKALLAHARPRVGLDEIHLRALRVLVTELKKQKYAVTSQPRTSAHPAPKAELQTLERLEPPHQRGRHVPAAVRRAVFEHDGGRCTYVSASGDRCSETHGLELHHVRAFALGGEHSEANLAYRCKAHNALAAEEDFGRDFVRERQDSLGHEPFARQRLRE